MKKTRPNLLLITTDQQRWDHLGVEGLRGIDTPNLDRLAREGTHFHRAYTCAPLCTPARVSLLTGQYPSRHGAYSLGVTLRPFPERTLATQLSAAGYRTGLFGKTHFVCRKDEAAQAAGFPNPPPSFFRDHTGPYLGFDEVKLSSGHTTMTVPEMHYRAWLEEQGVDASPWFPAMRGGHDPEECGPWNIPPEYHDTAWVAGNTNDFITRHRDEPWFCWASFQDPHEPFVCPEPWWSRVRMDEVETYEGYRPGEFDDKPFFYSVDSKIWEERGWPEFEDGHGVPCAWPRAKLTERARAALQATLGMVGFIDDRVGAMLATLEETGQLENTLVVFTSDHGELHGHHGIWHKGLHAYEDCQRVPLLVRAPDCAPRGTVQALANLVDLPRTLLAAAGLEPPPGTQGHDLGPVLRGETDRVCEATFIESHVTPRVYQTTMVTADHKLVVYRDLEDGELYDLNADPDQYRNLWALPEYADLKSALLHQYAREMMKREGVHAPRETFA